MKADAVIIGGGVAGLWCASELAGLGLTSVVVEKEPFPGGHVAQYCCKATDQCQRCGACLLEDVLDVVACSDRITSLLRTTVFRIDRSNGLFQLALSRRTASIYPEKCNECEECLRVCPAPGALVRAPRTNEIVVREDACLFFRDGSCKVCADRCPEGAVRLEQGAEDLTLEAASVVLACGFKAFDPLEKPRFGYGRVPGVITGLELETMLRDDNFDSGQDRGSIRSVAFIQCVGSRDAKIGRNYCSRVCCGYALRLARLLRRRYPGIEPAIFYMDIQTFDRDFENRLAAARREVRLIRAIPAEIRAGVEGKPELIYQGPEEKRVTESYDLVVLSVGMSPDGSVQPLAAMVGVEPNQDAFFGLDHDEVATQTKGVFVAGAVQGPRSIEESVSHAIGTAGEVASYVKSLRRSQNQ